MGEGRKRKIMFERLLALVAIIISLAILYFVISYVFTINLEQEKAKESYIKDRKEQKIETELVKKDNENPHVGETNGNSGSSKVNEGELGNSETNKPEIKTNSEGSIVEEFNKANPFEHLASPDLVVENRQEKVNQLPLMLQDSIKKYPENNNEILKYFEWKSDPKLYDLSGVYEKGDLPRFIQWDARWGFEKISNSYIAHSACGPVNMSAAYIYFTGDTKMNPVVMSKWAVNNNYFDDSYGSKWSLFTEGANKLGLQGQAIPFELERIKRNLDHGTLIILSVGKGDFTKGGHIIMVHGYEGDKLKIHDVNSPKNSSVLWDFERVSPQVSQAWAIWK